MKKKFKKLLGLAAIVFAGKKAFDFAKKAKEENEIKEGESNEDVVDVEN